MTLPTNPTICVLGCGTMGRAILSGILDSLNVMTASETPTFIPKKYIACVSGEESAQRITKEFNDKITVLIGQNVEGIKEADIVLLCTKPQIAKIILTEEGMQEALENKLVISILAGVTIKQLNEWVPSSARVIRAMPNTPCMIREGMTVLSCPANCSKDDKSFGIWVFSTLGRTRILDEKHLDAVTGLSGSGPAFACVVLEALADGGVMMGLPREVGLELAAQALQGAARMVLKTGKHPAEIKDSVTTPAGCTIAGLLTMEDGKIRSTLARTIQEATHVASTLGNSQDRK
ncbi:pyrroline-5-carboxylate reductase dimerization-domain-containing protein [Glomus cerebriforme]|uniref:Pyrroline-5-carboxylate reductase n=1 Tax=Glomus cerebriforme TaxID=658196 RepID=A0A397T1G6_9GLOM|nr:pyrroline-5-carboxylate reductase dimerization-domain-containing protein [Glomus cerebriforme]